MENYIITETHISNIKIGDTVLHENKLQTVSRTNIGYDSFMGLSLFGDSYRSGYKLVKKVTFRTYDQLKTY